MVLILFVWLFVCYCFRFLFGLGQLLYIPLGSCKIIINIIDTFYNYYLNIEIFKELSAVNSLAVI